MSKAQALNIRSHFSLGKSILSPKESVKEAKSKGYDVVALCDDNTVSGMTDFFSEAEAQGVKPIVGVSLDIYQEPLLKGNDQKKASFYQIKLFAKTEPGVAQLFSLLTKANSDEQYYYKPRSAIEDVTQALKEGDLIVTTGDAIPLFTNKNADSILNSLIAVAGKDAVFVELVPADMPFYNRINKMAIDASAKFGIGKLLSRPALYKEGNAKERDMMAWLFNRGSANHPLRAQPFLRDLHLLHPKDMLVQAVETLPKSAVVEAVADMKRFADACEYKWEKQPMCLPQMAPQPFAELVNQCKAGWDARLKNDVFGYWPEASKLAEYRERLKYELSVIKQMGFENYFLLVAYVVNWSKNEGIQVGPARGSAAGSLVAYLTGITDVDPIRFGLIFERFLNPDRLDYPDIDLDFMSSRRQEVIDNLKSEFGDEYVAGISNYSMLGSASALRDISRIHDLQPSEYSCSKLIPKEGTGSVSLETAMETVAEIDQFAVSHHNIFKSACSLQGTMRGLGRHAAGIVVAAEPISTRAVVERREGQPTINWDKRIVEDWGLIKLDVLGLSTLDILRIALDKIEARHGKAPDIYKIPLNDQKTLDIFAAGETRGVFQFEGGTARHLLRQIAVGGDMTFEDIVAVNALNRPGPLDAGLTEKYVKIRQGALQPEYPNPRTVDALKETHSVIVYQEQVMKVARDLCSFTMAEADKLRKIMGKKQPEEMAKQSDKFVSGAVNNGMPEPDAIHLFNMIEKFAGYAFNKSHAVAYSLISYQAAYLKAHYPAEFFAASLSILKDEKLKPIANEAAAKGLQVVPPDINHSTSHFEIGFDAQRQQEILYAPLDRVKNVSGRTVTEILKARADGAFKSIDDMCSRVVKRVVNKRVVESLNAVGAFAAIEPTQLPARHEERTRDQKLLMPELTLDEVVITRHIDMSPYVQNEIAKIYEGIQDTHPNVVLPAFGKKPLFVVVTDAPAFSENKDLQMASGKSFEYMQRALKANSLKKSDGYYCSLLKCEKKEKQPTVEEVKEYAPLLNEEIALIKPPLIIACGGAAIRHFVPDVKGGFEELAGQIHYSKELDCNVLFGFNPMMVYPRPEMQEKLDEIMGQAAELIGLK